MSDIRMNLADLRQRVDRACAAAGRAPQAVRVVAVGKAFGVDRISQAVAAGQIEFGENYLQEAVAKITQLPRAGLVWHFIGPIQSNKTAGVAAHFQWAHTVDRLKIAERLSAHRPPELAPLQVCVQVNISGEASKSGCAPGEAAGLCAAVAGLPRLQLRGLMAIAAPAGGGHDVRADYRRLRELFGAVRQSLAAAGAQFDTLSAGMSDDLEAAIAEGATLVRVGSAIFGRRPA